ncbi:MAG: hypothetical protein AVDCRST_MAG33-899, partial [uncultured Thermomicrobiales bacterium]
MDCCVVQQRLDLMGACKLDRLGADREDLKLPFL